MLNAYIVNVKYLTFILSLYFLTLSSFPCADVIEGLKSTKELHTEQSEQNSTDGCAIFCICNCCGVVITSIRKQCGVDTPYQYSTHFLPFVEHPLNSLLHSVWQPPKQA